MRTHIGLEGRREAWCLRLNGPMQIGCKPLCYCEQDLSEVSTWRRMANCAPPKPSFLPGCRARARTSGSRSPVWTFSVQSLSVLVLPGPKGSLFGVCWDRVTVRTPPAPRAGCLDLPLPSPSCQNAHYFERFNKNLAYGLYKRT